MIQIERHFSAERINEVINDPSVRPWVANGSEVLNIEKHVANRNHVLLMGEHGGCMFFRFLPGVYEVHTNVERAGRGEWTDALTAACARWMFTRTDCYEVLTRVPEGHLAARAAAIARGMRYEFTRPKECLFRDRPVDVDIYSIRLQDWIHQDSINAELMELGRQFHEVLHDRVAALGIQDEPHAEDHNHNLYVGIAYEMFRHGQLGKAIYFYNRWALASRHEPIFLVNKDPVTIKIDHGLFVTLRGLNIEVTRPG